MPVNRIASRPLTSRDGGETRPSAKTGQEFRTKNRTKKFAASWGFSQFHLHSRDPPDLGGRVCTVLHMTPRCPPKSPGGQEVAGSNPAASPTIKMQVRALK